MLNSLEELYITLAAADNSFARVLNPHGGPEFSRLLLSRCNCIYFGWLVGWLVGWLDVGLFYTLISLMIIITNHTRYKMYLHDLNVLKTYALIKIIIILDR